MRNVEFSKESCTSHTCGTITFKKTITIKLSISYKNVVCLQLDKCMNMDSKKQLYIISGCNGAGKTTASYTVLPDVLECKEFVNADEIARGLSPFNPESMAIEAGR